VAPYSGQRISPVFFPQTDPFDIEVVSNDTDLDSIQLQIRTKQPDSVWEPWRNLSGMVWQDGGPNTNVEVFDRLDRNPPRREFTFKWTESEIKALGVGEYVLRAVAKDKATNPNTDIDPPDVAFLVDDSKPTVLTTTPDYQAREKERTYRGELSALFTDDMRADDFSDRTFAVTDLLKGGQKVAGFVSYSPALRKAIFVPVMPFIPNGFYRVEIKTDTDNAGVIERGVHDLAGNPLDNAFMWTFRTKDAPFEETWSITLSATDGVGTDANNIAAVGYGAEDGEDEKDARAVPGISNQLRLSFLDRDKVEFDRDIRPADGRLSHHWFFVVDNAASGATVILRWEPSIKLVRNRDLRQYKDLWLIEYTDDGNGNLQQTNRIPLSGDKDPSNAKDADGLPTEVDLYDYISDGSSHYFRLDVQKASFVAKELAKGTSGWKFFSVPITPERAEPFVNLGDDIDPFKLYQYDTELKGFKIYPLDLGEVALRTGHAYFTRLEDTLEVDVGGTSNLSDVTLALDEAGWHAIGNPFVESVKVADVTLNGDTFAQAVSNGSIEPTLYRWVAGEGERAYFKTATSDDTQTISELDSGTIPQELADAFADNGLPLSSSAYVEVVDPGQSWEICNGDYVYDVTYNGSYFKAQQKPDFYQAANVNQHPEVVLLPWEGYWLKTNVNDLTLTIPAPDGIADAESPLPDSFNPPMAPPIAVQIPPSLKGGIGLSAGGFDLKLALTSQFASDVTTVLGTHPDAQMSMDPLDTSEPPTLGQTVAVYFEHPEWDGLYNTDYQPLMEVGETRAWQFVVFTDQKGAQMTLSWASAMRMMPDDILLSFRRVGEEEWRDMREIQSVEFISQSRITKIPFEVRAERFAMSPPADVQVIAGQAQVRIRWKPGDNPFIAGYSISRRTANDEHPTVRHLRSDAYEFIDADVEEEETYTYQVSVRFISGAELRSDLFTVTVLPVIRATALLQNYPNPFNPETWVPYELAEETHVSIEVYTASGQMVRRLDLGLQKRGRYLNREKAVYWDGCNESGERAVSGTYFYVLRAGDFSAARKMVILR
jgi:hypothetical protein